MWKIGSDMHLRERRVQSSNTGHNMSAATNSVAAHSRAAHGPATPAIVSPACSSALRPFPFCALPGAARHFDCRTRTLQIRADIDMRTLSVRATGDDVIALPDTTAPVANVDPASD